MFGNSAASPMYSNVWVIRSNQNSNYNGIQVTLEQRLTHRVSARGYYSWSKTLQSNALDSTSGLNGTFVDANYRPTRVPPAFGPGPSQHDDDVLRLEARLLRRLQPVRQDRTQWLDGHGYLDGK